MSMGEQLIDILGVALLGGVVVAVTAVLRRMGANNSNLRALTSSVADVQQRVASNGSSTVTSGELPELIERIEAVERRTEAVHKDCLRFLQRGEQAMRTADRAREALMEDEEQQTLVAPQAAPPAEPEVSEEELTREWARREVMRRGETPIG